MISTTKCCRQCGAAPLIYPDAADRVAVHARLRSRCMRIFAICALLLALQTVSHAGEVTITNQSEAAQFEQLYQRFLKEMREAKSNAPPGADLSFFTNIDTPASRDFLKRFVVHPSFGLGWDEVPAPTITGSNALKGVDAFVAANGWNMCTNFVGFVQAENTRAIRGLPWEVIREREFPAVTWNGILFVTFRGFGISKGGVAYNPRTNDMSGLEFKHLGQHWYAWVLPDDGNLKVQKYEGAKR